MTAIIQDIVSIFFVLGLGYFAGRSRGFSAEQTEGFNRLVLNYALPASLFASIARSTRAELFSDWPTLLGSLIVLLGWFFAAFAVARFVFHRERREAGIAALVGSAPTVGFLGMAVLTPVFGGPAALTVAIAAIVLNVIQVPLGIFLVASDGAKPAAAVFNAVRQPVVLAPLAAILIVLAGIEVPAFALPPLALIGHATSGVAVFAAGLVLAVHAFHFNREVAWNACVKLVLMPASMLAVGLSLGIAGEKLEELVLLAALPSAFIGVILSGRYQIYASSAAATLIVTAILFGATAPVWLAITAALAK